MNKNTWIVIILAAVIIVIICLIGQGSGSSNSPTTTPASQQITTNLQDVALKSKCASDGKVFIQNYEVSLSGANGAGYRPVWGDAEYHFNSKLNTCLAYIWWVQEINVSSSGSLTDSNYTFTIDSTVYNMVFDIYSNQLILQSVSDRTSTKGGNTDTPSQYPLYGSVPNLDVPTFFAQLKTLMSE